MTRRGGGGGIAPDSQPASLFSRKIMRNIANFKTNFEKMVQKIMITAIVCILSEHRKKSVKNSLINLRADFHEKFEKICKNHRNLRKSEIFEM